MQKLFFLTLLVVVVNIATSSAQDLSAQRKKHFNTEDNLAIEGYDPVSYFADKKAAKGKSTWSFNYGNVMYYFNSQAHLNLFKKNPTGYEPQFGGWCAYAMGNTGEKVEIDPKTFKIVNDKLYLFYNKFFNNTLKTWNTNEGNLTKQANTNWSKIFK